MKKKQIFKANGITFTSLDDVLKYAKQNGYYISNAPSFDYKGTKITTCNLKSI